MSKITKRDLQIALAQQYIRLGIGNAWNDQNEDMESARQIMKKHNITLEDFHRVCGGSEQLQQIHNMEKNAHLQGNKFIACIHGWFYVMDYEMNITGF